MQVHLNAREGRVEEWGGATGGQAGTNAGVFKPATRAEPYSLSERWDSWKTLASKLSHPRAEGAGVPTQQPPSVFE